MLKVNPTERLSAEDIIHNPQLRKRLEEGNYAVEEVDFKG